MKVQKAYRYELKPNNVQLTLLAKHAGCARFAYNWGLARRREEYQRTGKSSNAIEQHKQLNALKRTEFPWMYEVSKCAPQEALRNLDQAYQHFFRCVKHGEKPGFPKFKKKGIHDSFRLTGAIGLTDKSHIHLPRIGRIRTKELTEKFAGKILSATVKREADRWYVSLQVECSITAPEPLRADSVGIDLGITSFAALSDGTKIESPHPLKRYLKKLARLSKVHSRKLKGSNNRRKSAIRLARLHRRIKNIRNDFLHKLSTPLAKTKSAIGLENLNTKKMMENGCLARLIADSGWAQFIRMLEYKTSWYGSRLVFAPEHYPTTRTCSSCGYIIESLPLSMREWSCPHCHEHHDRDFNSSKVLLRFTTASSAGINACGEAVQQGSSVKQEENAVYPAGING